MYETHIMRERREKSYANQNKLIIERTWLRLLSMRWPRRQQEADWWMNHCCLSSSRWSANQCSYGTILIVVTWRPQRQRLMRMEMSWHEGAFHITGRLVGKVSHQSVKRRFDVFVVYSEQYVKKQTSCRRYEAPWCSFVHATALPWYRQDLAWSN